VKRVLLVTNIPNPYRIPLFNELHQQLERQDIQLRVLFAALGYRRRKWMLDMSQCCFEYDVLSSRTFEIGGDAEKTIFTYGGLFQHLRKYHPDAVVVAGFSLATLQLWLNSWVESLPYIIWTGSVKGVWTNRAGKRTTRSLVRTLQRKAMVSRAAGFVAYGSSARTYLIDLGVSPEIISIGINTVDTRYFAEETQRLRKQYASGSVARSEKQHLTYIGDLSARKGTPKMLQALQKAARIRTDFVLDLIGDGADRPRLEAFVQENNLSEHVRFHGYRQRGELPAYLAQSCCLLYPTNYDVWGLAVVEAMAAGLPVIASANAGVTHDLVQDGITGFAVDFADIDSLADRICWVLDQPEEAAAMGRRGSAFIAQHATIEKSAAGFVEAITRVLGTSKQQQSSPERLSPV